MGKRFFAFFGFLMCLIDFIKKPKKAKKHDSINQLCSHVALTITLHYVNAG